MISFAPKSARSSFFLKQRNCIGGQLAKISVIPPPSACRAWNTNVSNVQIRHLQICRLEKIRGENSKLANHLYFQLAPTQPLQPTKVRDEMRQKLNPQSSRMPPQLLPSLSNLISGRKRQHNPKKFCFGDFLSQIYLSPGKNMCPSATYNLNMPPTSICISLPKFAFKRIIKADGRNSNPAGGAKLEDIQTFSSFDQLVIIHECEWHV